MFITSEKIKQINETKERLTNDLNREPLSIEIATELGIDYKEVEECLSLKVEEKIEESNDFSLRFKLTIKNQKLEKARRDLKLKQSEIADKIGIGMASYNQIECCRSYPQHEIITKISKILNQPESVLFPLWLKIFSTQWNRSEKSKIIPITKLSLSNPEVLNLDSGDFEKIISGIDSKIGSERALKVLDNYKSSSTQAKSSDRFREIIILRFLEGLTLEEAGKKIGVSRERVRQIEAKALEIIRQDKYFKRYRLKEYGID